jgi:serine/threonine protein kinase
MVGMEGLMPPEVFAVTAQLQQALQVLHSIKIMHLDVKPGNCLFCQTTRVMKLCDLGMAEGFPVTSSLSCCWHICLFVVKLTKPA